MNFEQLIEGFIRYLRVEKKYSAHTCISYENDLIQCATFITQQYEIDSIEILRHTHIRTWMVHLMGEDISPVTVNRKISALRSWYKWMLKRKLTDTNPMLKIVAPKKPKRLPVTVQGAAIDRLVEPDIVIDEADMYDAVRDAFIIELFYSTGMRRAELVGLNLNDFNLQRMDIRVLGKGNKVRMIPITDGLAKAFSRYREYRSHVKHILDHEALFLTASGKRIYPRLIHTIVSQKLQQITTLSKKSPHVLRHSFATHILDEGGDINAIKEILGHASLAATQIYTHNSIAKLKEAYSKSHPRS